MDILNLRPVRWLALALVASLVTACGDFPSLYRVLGPPNQQIQCTPPPCAADETYACGLPNGDCPGGCGTICVRKTPDPAGVTPVVERSLVCPIVVRTPPPEAPTAEPNEHVDPHVEICAEAVEVTVGQPVVIRALAVDIG